MAKPNYQFEKRQRDLAKKRKQEEKRQAKLANKAANNDSGDNSADAPGNGPDDPAPQQGCSPRGLSRRSASSGCRRTRRS